MPEGAGLRVDPMKFVTGRARSTARTDLKTYFASYTGSHFERLADTKHPHEITANDLVAVSMLSVDVPASAAIWILGDGHRTIAKLLQKMPVNQKVWDARANLGRGSPASELWDLLRTIPVFGGTRRSGMGRTTTSKLLAAKRPHLFPIYDSVVARELKIGPRDDFWTAWQNHLRSPAGVQVRSEVARLRKEAGVPRGVSTLRILDVVIWMAGQRRGRTK